MLPRPGAESTIACMSNDPTERDLEDQPPAPSLTPTPPATSLPADRGRYREVRQLAEAQHGVVTLEQLRELGVTPGRRRAQIAAGRWQQLPHRAVLVGGGRGTDWAAWWTTLAEVGRPAALGGVPALMADGLTGYVEDVIHVWLPKSSRVTRPSGTWLHETRRWGPDDHAPQGIPRARPAVATVQAALWAVSRRQAVLTMVMPIQQRLTRAQDVAEVLDRVKRHRFRSCLRHALADIAGGAHSMNELDFAHLCRDYGLPEPSRQVVREGPNGRIYLDVAWEAYRVCLEINGAGHARPEQVLKDNFRTIDLQLRGETAIELSVLTLRAAPEEAMSRIAQVLRANGWHGIPLLRPARRRP